MAVNNCRLEISLIEGVGLHSFTYCNKAIADKQRDLIK